VGSDAYDTDSGTSYMKQYSAGKDSGAEGVRTSKSSFLWHGAGMQRQLLVLRGLSILLCWAPAMQQPSDLTGALEKNKPNALCRDARHDC
jgi:hypothetical protein